VLPDIEGAHEHGHNSRLWNALLLKPQPFLITNPERFRFGSCQMCQVTRGSTTAASARKVPV